MTKLKGHKNSRNVAIACFIIAAVALAYMLYGCAGVPVKRLEVFTVDRVTVFCAPDEFIKKYYMDCGGDEDIKDRVHSFVDHFMHIYTPCIEINGLVLPADQNALGHELWHVINFKHPKKTMNPDSWEAR